MACINYVSKNAATKKDHFMLFINHYQQRNAVFVD